LASSRLDLLVIPFLIGDIAFGQYSVAQRLSEPVITLARSIAMTRFKAFAGRTRVSDYIIRWNALLMTAAVLGFAVFGTLAFPSVPLRSLRDCSSHTTSS
jgi:O-antigen/teichoic acid export membrane protein